MKDSLKKWMPVTLCCVPGVAAAAIVGVGAILGGAWVNGPVGTGLIALGALACPVSHAVLMRRMSHNAAPGQPQMTADCCAPTKPAAAVESDRLTALRARREEIEREVAELQAN